jgi:hypothetical protein
MADQRSRDDNEVRPDFVSSRQILPSSASRFARRVTLFNPHQPNDECLPRDRSPSDPTSPP